MKDVESPTLCQVFVCALYFMCVRCSHRIGFEIYLFYTFDQYIGGMKFIQV